MKTFRIFIVLALFAFLVSGEINTAKAIDSTEVQPEEVWEQTSSEETYEPNDTSQTEDSKVEAEKKKKKDKDIVKLNNVFFINLAINLVSVLFIIFVIYYPRNKKPEYIFTFFLFNVVIFMLTYVLNEVKISMGAAFGLFAVFSMLRYRTAGISMKDMTYLFLFIALGLISAIRLDFYNLLIINGILIALICLLDSNVLFKHETAKTIEYDNLKLINPENREQLIEDIRNRTGFNVHRVVIDRVNLLKDSVRIKVYFYE